MRDFKVSCIYTPAANMSDKEALVKERVVKNKDKNHYTNS